MRYSPRDKIIDSVTTEEWLFKIMSIFLGQSDIRAITEAEVMVFESLFTLLFKVFF